MQQKDLFQYWLPILGISILGLASAPVQAKTKCLELSAIRQAYYKDENYLKARSAVQCVLHESPSNVDAKYFLSQLDWWEQHPAESAQEAPPLDEIDFTDAVLQEARLAVLRFTATGGVLFSSSQTGRDEQADVDYRYSGKNHLEFTATQESRGYADGNILQDNIFELTHVNTLSKRLYLETYVEYSPTAQFSPKEAARVEPHYVFRDDSDVSFGIQYSHYNGQNAASLMPQWIKPLTDRLTTGARFYGVIAGIFLPSIMLFETYQLTDRFFPRFSVAGGRTLEEPLVYDSFYELSLDLGYSLTPKWTVHLIGDTYQGTLRTENTISGAISWQI